MLLWWDAFNFFEEIFFNISNRFVLYSWKKKTENSTDPNESSDGVFKRRAETDRRLHVLQYACLSYASLTTNKIALKQNQTNAIRCGAVAGALASAFVASLFVQMYFVYTCVCIYMASHTVLPITVTPAILTLWQRRNSTFVWHLFRNNHKVV